MNRTLSLEELHRAVSVVAAAVTPSEVFRRLIETAMLAAPKVAVLLVRQGLVKGWGCAGYTAESSKRLRAFSAAADGGWLGSLVASEQRGMIPRGGEHDDPDFGQTVAETVGAPLRVGDRPVALLVAERGSSQAPWEPDFLAVLIAVAEVRLELDLARRKIKRLQEERSGAAPGPRPEAAPAPSTAPETVELAPTAPRDESGPANDELTAARRYARLIATDIRLYNEEAVMKGRMQGDLASRMKEHLDRGRETFLRRYGDLGSAGQRILHEAFVEVLANGQAGLMTASEAD